MGRQIQSRRFSRAMTLVSRDSARRSRRSAAGWFLGGRAAAGVEYAQHPQRGLAGVLQAVRRAGGEVQAAAGGKGAIFVAHVQHALPRQDQHDLVVGVGVEGRPAGRDLADELGGGFAALAWGEQDTKFPVPGYLWLL